ncbi:MAG: ZIP family metal transporter [Candidatus Woesearchaeota archaeon]
MSVVIPTILSVLAVSLVSFIGALFLAMNPETLKKMVLFLVSFATGAILGDVFIHLLPETMKACGQVAQASYLILAGLLVFFVVEKFIHWRHCHIPTSKQHPHSFAIMNLVGDGFHNLLDGAIIAGAYIASFQAGLATTVAVLLHEIPQEIGDFAVLIHGGYTRRKALFFNFLSAITSVVGAIITLLISNAIPSIEQYVLPFAMGGLLYIAGSDLIPELHRDTGVRNGIIQLIGLIVGIGVMSLLLLVG